MPAVIPTPGAGGGSAAAAGKEAALTKSAAATSDFMERVIAGRFRLREGKGPNKDFESTLGRGMKVVVGFDDESPTVEAVISELERRRADLEVLSKEAWPKVARAVGEAVSSGRADMGVLFCWTGTGTSMMANKVAGVRAALCWEPWIAEGARRWNDANVLVMSLKRTPPDRAIEILDAWLSVDRPDADEAPNIAALSKYEKESSR